MREFTTAPHDEPVSGDGGGGEPLIRPTAGGHRKNKGSLVRAWLVVGSTGQAEVVEFDKRAITQKTGLPARDLRMLDPALSYPSTVLGRERAIVVNLEHIKSIITSKEMFFQNSKDPLLTPFVQKIQGIFRHRHAVMSTQESGGDGGLYNSEQQETKVDGRDDHIFNSHQFDTDVVDAHRLKLLPLEFVALETCIYATCSNLDDQATRLEQEAYPALDKLTNSKICTLNLNRVRIIKRRLVSLTARVKKVRDELEHLLDDDGDMAKMYLTEKLEEQQQLDDNDSSSSSSTCSSMKELENNDEQVTRKKSTNRSVKELEMILETYFVGIEGTLNKLYTLKEDIDGTDDHIKISLDSKQNRTLKTNVVLTTANLAVTGFVALAGVFGMNVHIDLFDDTKAGNPEFLWTVGGGTIGCILCFVAAMAWCRRHRIL